MLACIGARIGGTAQSSLTSLLAASCSIAEQAPWWTPSVTVARYRVGRQRNSLPASLEFNARDRELARMKAELELAKKDVELAKKDVELELAKKDAKLAKAAQAITALQYEKQKLMYKHHKDMVQLLAAKKLLSIRGLIEFVEEERMSTEMKKQHQKRAERWGTYFKQDRKLVECAAKHGIRDPGAEMATIFRYLSDEVHNLDGTLYMKRFASEVLRFGPPLSLRQAELMVCVATHLGLRSEAHGVLEPYDASGQ